MILMLKKISRIFVAFLLLTAYNQALAKKSLNLFDGNWHQFDKEDEFEIDIPDTLPPAPKFTRALTDDEVIGCVEILNDNHLISVLIPPIYLRTHPLNIRNVLDLPTFPFYLQKFERGIFSVDLFYNQTTQVRFDENSSRIAAYIALEDENLIRAIQNAEDRIRQDFPDFNLSIPSVLRLFTNTTIQERRAGLMFSLAGQFENVIGELHLPLLYTERNFFISRTEMEIINKAHIPGLCLNPDAPLSPFTKQHLIADRIGLGDTRISIGYPAVDIFHWRTIVSGEITIPTACAFKRGLIGSKFTKSPCKPSFDICELLTLGINGGAEEQAEATMLATNFFVGALDRLSANLLDEPDGRHIGLGAFTQSDITFTDHISLHNKTILRYQTAANAKRFFVKKRDIAALAAHDFTDETKAQENLDFINQQFIDQFYPYLLQVRVKPGFIFNSKSRLYLHKENVGLSLGTDMWWKQREKIDMICTPCQDLQRMIDVEKGVRDEAYQSKVFAAISYKKETIDRNWLISLAIDKTTTATSIGEDFTVAFGFEFDF